MLQEPRTRCAGLYIYKVGYFDASNLLEQWFGLSACSHFLIGVLRPLGFWKESFGSSSNSTAYLCLCCNIIFHNKNLILFECKLYIVCILALQLYNTRDGTMLESTLFITIKSTPFSSSVQRWPYIDCVFLFYLFFQFFVLIKKRKAEWIFPFIHLRWMKDSPPRFTILF